MIDLVLAGGTIATVDGQFDGSLAVHEGRVVGVGHERVMPEAKRTIDVRGKLLIPGAIDGHVHFCEDLSILAEPYESGTRAAAAGGVTTVLLMPWDTPTLDSMHAFEYRKGYAAGRAYVDYGFHATVTAHTAAQSAENLPALWKAGITGVKVLMVTDDPHFPSLNDGELVDVLRILRDLNGLLIVHAENQTVMEHERVHLEAAGRTDPLTHEEWRSTLSENEAVRRLIYFAENVGARVMVAHMSTGAGVRHVEEARRRGAEVYAEVCPRNLFLDTDDLAVKGPWVKTGPPVRKPEEVDQLWAAMASGGISVLSSDHAAWTKENKEAGLTNIWMADGGIPQIQESLPLMLDAVNAGRLSLSDLVRVTSFNPSLIYGLQPRKGQLLPGYDADIVVVDMDLEDTVRPELLEYHVGWSAFDGRRVKGWPVMTLVRGEIVAEDRKIVGTPAHGQFIGRQAS